MLDRLALLLTRPAILAVARPLARAGVSANALTWTGFAIGLLAAGLISQGAFLSGLLAIGASRVCDALDGAVARQTQATDLGGFLDITLDFVFYASIPLAFAVADPARNALAAAVLLASFVGTEGTETLAFFAACCLWPHYFAPLAYGFAALCGLTLVSRVVWGMRAFANARRGGEPDLSGKGRP